MVNGTIRKEGNIFIGQIAIGKYDNGRIKYKRFKGKKKSDVIKKMEEFKKKEESKRQMREMMKKA